MSFSGSERDEKLVPNKSDKSKIFYCHDLGCANKTKSVFCGDVNLLKDTQTIEHCRGPPELNQICQQDSRAYVNTTENSCEFEGVNSYLLTSECTDLDPCNWSDVTTLPSPLYNNNGTDIGAGGNYTLGVTNGTQTPPDNTDAVYGLIGVGGIVVIVVIVVVVVVLLICFFIYRRLKKKCKNNNRRSGRKRNETNGIPMVLRKQVGNGSNGTDYEPEGVHEDEFIPPAPSSGA
ncbi:uncharacterized protein isoform X2 [Takifugu rubripes]|uniref:uncharacterized protein isoform X2 n=1 Tax=Takifugu rubripes TaxID=31033 RepID=UPI001145A5FD|nr:uncharacterized protein LOC105418048 isoform X2 [Takifugu rubripes]XP_029686113.1 uncharacterized protein LOC105418048 isoform X2 [Takifugu rubripes]